MNNYLDLDRRFGLLSTYTQEQLFASYLSSKQLSWETVLQGSFSVVVARANFGKTTELRARSKALRDAGQRAVFVALNKVLGQDDFTEALEVDDMRAYEAWQEAPTDKLTIFVDSLDEATLSREDGLRLGLRRVGKAISWPNSNVRWVLSCRPAVLTPDAKISSFPYCDRGEIFTPTPEALEGGSVVHEVLHLRRLLVDGIPRPMVPDDYEGDGLPSRQRTAWLT